MASPSLCLAIAGGDSCPCCCVLATCTRDISSGVSLLGLSKTAKQEGAPKERITLTKTAIIEDAPEEGGQCSCQELFSVSVGMVAAGSSGGGDSLRDFKGAWGKARRIRRRKKDLYAS